MTQSKRSMDGALTATPAEDIRRRIPAELVEEILLNLPQKSVVRFSSVSKSWNTMIHGSRFVKRYRGMIFVFEAEKFMISWKTMINGSKPIYDMKFMIPLDYLLCPNLSSDNTHPLFCPFTCKPYLLASCNELWCVEVGDSLFLWNPSMRTHRKLPNSSLPPQLCRYRYDHNLSFGIGYDSVHDDYKILKILKGGKKGELFSLKSNSWRTIQPFTRKPAPRWSFSRVLLSLFNEVFRVHEDYYHLKMGVFVAGALHWMAVPDTDHHPRPPLGQCMVISFDLSTEKYRELGLPELEQRICNVETAALKGMLCLCVNYWSDKFVLWMMEDYGVVESWTMKLHINFERNPCLGPMPLLRPLYLYDNGEILISVCADGRSEEEEVSSMLFVYKDEQTTLVEKSLYGTTISNSLVYVESLVLVNNFFP